MAHFTRPDDDVIDAEVAKLHKAGVVVYVATTGSAGRLTQDLWATPGASSTVLRHDFTYDQEVGTKAFLEFDPVKFCTPLTARYMAAQAHAHARRASETERYRRRPAFGLGMTSAVATDRVLRGGERAYIAVRGPGVIWSSEVRFVAGELTRRQQGELCDLLALNLLLHAVNGLPYPSFVTDATVTMKKETIAGFSEPMELTEHSVGTFFSMEGKREVFIPNSPGTTSLHSKSHLIFPGSFNPVSSGHDGMAALAERNTGMKVVFQLNASHPVKGEIPAIELSARVGQFINHRRVLLIQKGGSLYIEKARMLPGFSFLIGVDAVRGVLNPVYYGGHQGLLDVLAEFDRLGTRFHVVGRVDEDDPDHFVTLEEVPIPQKYAHLFIGVSGRWDVSSTKLREE